MEATRFGIGRIDRLLHLPAASFSQQPANSTTAPPPTPLPSAFPFWIQGEGGQIRNRLTAPPYPATPTPPHADSNSPLPLLTASTRLLWRGRGGGWRGKAVAARVFSARPVARDGSDASRKDKFFTTHGESNQSL
uniref:Uncharacterized protein n=1 Tax=Oryza barthii TaxID=65489 RepID=A0A0D3HKW3_9ORYZ